MEDFVVELSSEEELLRQVIEPLLDSEGFELVRIKLKKAQSKSLLVLFVDAREHGIVINDLEDISGLLSDVLDASFGEGSLLGDRYDLEVSSPGLDRPLCKLSHFGKAVGERIKIRVKNFDAGGAKNILGVLLDASNDSLAFEPDNSKGEKLVISYDNVVEANIVFDFSKLDRHKKNANKLGEGS